MKVSSRFTVAVHTVLCIAHFQDEYKVTSDFIASSTNVNPVIIRNILGQLQGAGLVSTKAGVGGSELIGKPSEITLLDIYKAVTAEEEDDRLVFNFHTNPNKKCPVGSKIHDVLDPCLTDAQTAMEKQLQKTSVKDLLNRL